MTLLALSIALSLAVVTWTRRQWLPTRAGRPWWRMSVLTGSEDLRLGAATLAVTATVAAVVGVAHAQAWREHLGRLRPVQGVVVARTPTATTVDVHTTARRVVRRVTLDAGALSADVGSVVRVYLGSHRVVADDEAPTWNEWTGSCLVLLVAGSGCALASLTSRARRRLVPYRL